MITIMNQMAEKWFSWQLSMFWQVGLLIVIVAGFDLLIKKWAWPQVRYALWLLILVKLILPPTLTSPTSFTAEIPFIAKEAVIKISQPQTMPQAIEVIKKPIEPIIVDTTTHPVEIVPVAPAAPAAVYLSWKVHTFFVWLAGVAILSGWLVIRLSNLRHQHLKDKPQSNLPERLEGLLASTTQKLNLRKVPQVILTNKICCPAVFGIFKPVLLIPADKLQNLTAQDAENIFLHELAHIKRGDLLVHAIYMILQIAYWFNPLLWLIRKQLQNLRELCCDATVARLLREKTIGYRQTLLETARQLLAEPVDPGLGLLGLFENSGWLVDRLGWLEKKSWKYRPLRIATIFVLISLMAACVLPMTKFEAPPGFTTKGVTVEEGIGFDDIIVGDGNCTIEFIKSRLGQPDEDLEDKQTNGYWLNYIKKYGLDFWFNRHKVLYEIRLDKGFKGKLTSGISLASKRQDVFATYGKPISEEFTDNLPKCYGNQILFKLKGAKNSKIYYEQKGLLFWFDGDSVTQIVIHIPKEFSKKTCLSTEHLQNLVEDFFRDNYRDIKQRKTIEWGQPTTDKNGNSSIRYKYEARIWDKDKYIFDELFTFSKDDKFVSSKKLSQILVENPVDNDTPAGQERNRTVEQVNNGTGENSQKSAGQGIVQGESENKQQVYIETRIIFADDSLLESLNFVKDPNNGGIYFPTSSGSRNSMLNDEQVSKILRACQAHKKAEMLTAPRVTVLDGEEAYISIVKETEYISDYNEHKGLFGKPQPKTDTVTSGVVIKVLPKLQPDNTYILLDADVKYLTATFEEFVNEKKRLLQLPTTETWQIQTTVSMQEGKTLLLGGIRVKTGTESNLLILIKAEKIKKENSAV